MKISVYTCITKGYDRALPGSPNFDWEMDLVAFTDSNFQATNGWSTKALHCDSLELRPDLINRFHKILYYKVLEDSQVSIYIDGNVQMGADFKGLIQDFISSGKPIGLSLHTQRSSILEELDACKDMAKFKGDDSSRGDAQVRRYLEAGLPWDYPLYSATVIFRNHKYDVALKEAMNLWWEQVVSHTARDQLSLPFVLWVTGIEPFILKFDIFDNPYFIRYSHDGQPPSKARMLRKILKSYVLRKIYGQ